MNAREHAARLVVLKAIKDRVLDVEKHEKADAMKEFAEGDRLTAAGPQGEPIGTVTVVKGRRGWRVYDEHAFLEWCIAHHPDAVDMTVRDSDKKAIIAAIKTGGEVPDGVEESEGDPYFLVKPDYHAVQQIDWRPYIGQPTIEQGASDD